MTTKFRGLKNVVMIMVVEGAGTSDDPSREVRYFYDLERHGGTHGGFVGKIDPLGDMADSAQISAKSLTPKEDSI